MSQAFVRVAVVLLFSSLITAPAADGQGAYPPPRELHVNDFANRLSAKDQERIRDLLRDARQRTGIEATVVLLDSIRDYPAGNAGFDSFVTGLGNAWGVGSAERDDGVVILVALTDRKVRIGLGAGYTARDSQLMQTVLDQILVPRLRAGDVAGGLYEGARAALETLADPPPAAENLGHEAPPESTSNVASPFWKRLSAHPHWLLAVGMTILLVALAAGVVEHRRPLECGECGLPMTRLDEAADNEFLTPQQRTEETIRSLNYHVWRCERCETTQVVPRRDWISSFYTTCPRCGGTTLRSESHILCQPTYSSTGKKRVVDKCAHCAYENAYTVDLPRQTRYESSSPFDSSTSGSYSRSSSRSNSRSSSSSGSSFGGGSSSGRGASGSW